jgi:predicted deacetylase
VFVPPAWKLNSRSIKVLERLGFKLAEEQEEYLLLFPEQQQEFKKNKAAKGFKLGFHWLSRKECREYRQR